MADYRKYCLIISKICYKMSYSSFWKYNTPIITARIRKVMFYRCLLTGGYPNLWYHVRSGGGGEGYPSLRFQAKFGGEVTPPPPDRIGSTRSLHCTESARMCGAGGMSVAFMQEDFLVYNCLQRGALDSRPSSDCSLSWFLPHNFGGITRMWRQPNPNVFTREWSI